jgi:DNA-binding transcriptional ArsR family regulator
MEGHKIYIHRERGHVYVPFFTNMSLPDVLNLRIDGFCFVSAKQDDMGRFGCRVAVSTDKGQKFAGINLDNGKVFFDTKLGLQKTLNNFIKSLRVLNSEITSTEIEYSYVEICTRFSWDKVSEAYKLLEKVEINFRTKKTRTIKQGHDALSGEWLFLVKNVLFGKFTVNIKVYLFFNHSGKKYNLDLITGFNYEKLPKVEVQVKDSRNIEIAKAEAIPIILAFLDFLGCPSVDMTEDDYELVTFLEKYKEGYQQIFLHLNSSNDRTIPIIFRNPPKDRDIEIAESIAIKPRSVEEIRSLFDVSENTIRADLKRLEKEQIIYSRGRKGVEKMYAIRLQPLRHNRPLRSIPTKGVPLSMDKIDD